MKTPPKDVGASVRARLLSLAREQRDDFQLVLLRYANERRCARSLKGAKGFAYRHGEVGIRLGVPAAIGGAAYAGYKAGQAAAEP